MDGHTQQAPSVSIVIPTLNEVDNIGVLLDAAIEAARGDKLDVEVIVVDDGSTDGTRERVRSRESDLPVRLLERERDGGLAGAVLAGARAARSEVVVVMDGDLSHPPERIPELALPVIAGEAELVIGSRYVSGGSTPDWPWRRRLVSRVASALAWPLVDVRDPMSGYFAVHRERLLQVCPKANGYKIGMEVLAAGGESLKVVEVPIEFRDRRYGQSKLGTGQIVAYLDRLRCLSGGAVSPQSALRFAVVGMSGMALDLICFVILMSMGVTLAAAHITSFITVVFFNYLLNARWAFRHTAGMASVAPWRRGLRFAIVALLALLLRGAVLGMLIRVAGWPPAMAIVAAIAIAASVNYLGCAFFVFAPDSPAKRDTTTWRLAAIGVVGYLLLIRLFYLGLPELLMEEAYYWNYAEHPALSYLDHPPMVAWLISFGTAIFGNNEFGVRIGAFACWIVTAIYIYRTTMDWFDKSTALRAVMLIAVLPIFFVFGFYMTPDAPLIACWAGALFYLQRALLADNRSAWWGVGCSLGLGMLSKYTIALLGPASLVFILIDRRSRRLLLRPEPYFAAVLTGLIFLPVIVWNAQNQWASFAFQSVRRLEERPEFGLPLLVGAVLLLLTPTGLIGAVWSLLPSRMGGFVLPKRSGGQDARHEFDRRRMFAAVFILVPLSVFVAFSLRHDPKLNWAGPLWLAAIPILSSSMVLGSVSPANRILMLARRAWTPTILLAMLAYGVCFHYFTLGFPGVPYPDGFKMAGWHDLGRQVEQVEDDLEERTGEEPLVIGLDKYRIASQLAFYRTRTKAQAGDALDHEGLLGTTGSHLIGGNSLMFERWFPSPQYAGRDVILVDENLDRLMNPAVSSYFAEVSDVHSITVASDQGQFNRFYYRIGYDYIPSTADDTRK